MEGRGGKLGEYLVEGVERLDVRDIQLLFDLFGRHGQSRPHDFLCHDGWNEEYRCDVDIVLFYGCSLILGGPCEQPCIWDVAACEIDEVALLSEGQLPVSVIPVPRRAAEEAQRQRLIAGVGPQLELLEHLESVFSCRVLRHARSLG